MVYSFEHPAVQSRGMDENAAAAQRREMLRSQVTPEIAERLVSLHQTHPDVPPGALIAMATAGMDPMDDIAEGIERRAVLAERDLGFTDPGEAVQGQIEERRVNERERAERAQAEQEGLLGQAAGAVHTGLTTAARGAFMGMESAFEEVSRRATSALVAIQDPSKTYGQAMELSTPSQAALLATDEFGWDDLGEGFIPAGAVRERQEELKQRLTMKGEWMSPGRALATTVTEPGTTAFNLASGLTDAAFRIFGDPATYATAGLGKARLASKTFATDSVLLRGIRGATDEQHARQWWLSSAPGQRLREHLVEEADPYQVWQKLGGPEGKVGRDTARRIADARSPGELDEVVLPRLGPQGIPEKPVGSMTGRTIGRLTDPMFPDDVGSVFGAGYRVGRGIRSKARLLNWMPDATIDISDPDRAMTTLHRFLQGIRATPEDSKRIMDRAFRMGTDPERPDNWLELAKDVTEVAADRAIKDSVGSRTAATGTRAARREQHIRENLGRAFERKHDEIVNYFQTEAASPRSSMVTWIDGTERDLSRIPQLTTEFLSGHIPLPDMQDVRRHIGPYANAMRITHDLPRPMVEGVNDMLSRFMTSVWKPMVLLRGAYIARVVGEEQARMAASGLDSLFRHPMSYLAYQSGRKGGVGLTGDLVEDMKAFQSIAQRKGGGHIGRKAGDLALKDRVKYRRFRQDGTPIDDDAFTRAWADDLSMLVNDEPSALVARHGVDEAAEMLQRPQHRNTLNQIAESKDWREVADDPQALRTYLESVATRIEEKTRGNSDLINAIATGRLDGKQVWWGGPEPANSASALQKGLKARLDEVDIDEVWGRRFVTTSKRGGLGERFNTAVDFGADIIMSRPTNKMSRFPAWRQHYVRNVEEQMGFMDGPTQRRVIEWAKDPDGANLSRSEVRRLESKARAGQGSSITDLESADLIGRAAATRDTRKLLYELTEQGQFSDAARAAIPFAEAWKEILTSWTRIVRDRPSVMRRGQQVIEGARGGGFFYSDPSTGDEMFCVDEQTQALTRRGWVDHDELAESDEILSVDPETNAIRWEPVLGVYRFAHDGELIRWNGPIDALTTSDHRWLVEDAARKKAKEPRREFKTTTWLSQQKQRPIVVAGGEPLACASHAVFTDEFVELIGWVVTEGCYDQRGGNQGVSITQSQDINPEHTERIRVIAKHFADQGATATEWTPRRGGECTFYFGNGIASLVRAAAPDRQLTPEFLTSLTSPQAELLLDTLIDGDGHVRPNGHRQWTQSNEGRIAGFQMLCAMLGVRTTDRPDGNGGDGRMVWLHNARHMYTTNPQREHHEGVVWCPHVRTGTWMARRNGSTYWTGNTYPGGKFVSRALLSGAADSPLAQGALSIPGVGAAATVGLGAAGALMGEQPGEFDLEGRVEGLNLFAGTMAPGLGPNVTVPASMIVPDRPKFEWVRENVLFPFGEPEVEEGILEAQFPAWAQKLRTAWMDDPETDRIYANSVFDTAKALLATGEFSTDSPQEQDRLLSVAKERAKGLWLIRGASQFVVPTGPQARFRVKDLEQQWWPTQVVASEFHRLQQEHGHEEAVTEFLSTFGTDLMSLIQPKSRTVVPRPTDPVGDRWIQQNEEIVRDYNLTAGLIAPEDPTGEFDFAAYRRQFEEGTREQLTPQQMLWLSNNTLGNLAYRNGVEVIDKVAPSHEEARAARAALRGSLMGRFPGFNSHIGVAERPDVEEQITELQDMTTDPRLADRDVVAGIDKYLAARRQANALVEAMDSRSSTFKSSEETKPIRRWLRSQAERISEEHPEFITVFERVFDRELAEDDDPVEPGQIGADSG